MNSPARGAESSAKRVLICASKLGYETREFAEAAEHLGIQLIFATDRCHQLEDPWGDQAIPVRFERAQEAAGIIAENFRSARPDAVLALGDRAGPAAAYAAKAFGLPGNPPEAAEASRNKLRQRETLAAAGLPIPEFRALAADATLSGVPGLAFPIVLKPLTLSASQGVIRVNNADEFAGGVARLRALLVSPAIQALRDPASASILAERYVPGAEIAVEGLLTKGRLRVLAIFDKPDPLEGPYFEETIYVTPARLRGGAQAAIEECLSRAVAALGLVAGPIHAEFRVEEQGATLVPRILEIAARPIGGLCSRALRFAVPAGANSGAGETISLAELILRHALGFPGADWPRETPAAGVMMIPVPRSGIFDGVRGLDAAERAAAVTEIRITARLHDYVAAWPEGASYLGFIFARGDSLAEVESALRAAHSLLEFQFSPRLPVAR